MDKLKWSALAEMHLILREHGWEPEMEYGNGPAYWVWTRQVDDYAIFTAPLPDDTGREWPGQLWSESGGSIAHYLSRTRPPEMYFTVAGLRHRLKELALQQTHERPQPED
jgi:hypothetical protein